MHKNVVLPNSPARGFFQEVESLRGLAALAVVVEHCFWTFLEPTPGLFHTYQGIQPIAHWLIHTAFNGRASVLLFFIMSGFVLSLQLKREKLSPLIAWPAFVVRRVLRIVPAMWVSIFVCYGVARLTGSPSNADIPMLIRTLFFWDFYLLVPLWSLNIEMGCSLVFPLLYFISTRTGKTVNATLFILLLAMIFIVPMPPWDLRVEFMRYLVLFHAGVLCGEYGTKWMDMLGRMRKPLFWGAVFAFGVIPQLWIFQSTFVFFADRRWALLAEVPFCFFILSYVIHERGQPETALLRQAWTRYLGKISYSLFLFHFPILVTVQFYLFRDMSPTFSAITQRYPLAVEMMVFVIVLGISLVVASASYRWVEKPFIELGRVFGRFVKTRSASKYMASEAS